MTNLTAKRRKRGLGPTPPRPADISSPSYVPCRATANTLSVRSYGISVTERTQDGSQTVARCFAEHGPRVRHITLAPKSKGAAPVARETGPTYQPAYPDARDFAAVEVVLIVDVSLQRAAVAGTRPYKEVADERGSARQQGPRG
jgi:hypothetical protein